jgi:hypothetical protein
MYIKDKVVFINKIEHSKDSFYCDLCKHVLTSMDDFNYHKEYNTCNECYLTFVESRKKEWLTGWRPDKQKIKEYILFRKSIFKNK